MNFYVGKLRFEQSQILHDERVDTGLLGFPGGFDGLIKLVVVNKRIERHIDAGTVLMRKIGDSGEILKGVASGLACAERRSSNVDGVGTVQTAARAVSRSRAGERSSSGAKGRMDAEHSSIDYWALFTRTRCSFWTSCCGSERA